jgi:hypothetical protein
MDNILTSMKGKFLSNPTGCVFFHRLSMKASKMLVLRNYLAQGVTATLGLIFYHTCNNLTILHRNNKGREE